MTTTYELTREDGDIVIRLPIASVDEQSLSKLLDYLELESILRRSQLSAEDASAISAEIKQGAWRQVKHLFEE